MLVSIALFFILGLGFTVSRGIMRRVPDKKVRF